MGQTVDCPHREQAQYLADTDLQAETLLYNFHAIPVVEKTLSDFADAQREDGTFPFVAPSNDDRPEFRLHIPEWDLHYASLLMKLYEASGDASLLDKYYEPLRRMINHFIAILDRQTGLIPLHEGWHISDWPYPSVEHAGQHLTVQQVKFYMALRIAGRVASILGRSEESGYYYGQSDQLRSAIVQHLYDPKRKQFRDSSESGQAHQGVAAIALYAGLVPEEDRERVIHDVAEKEWECRTVLSLPLLRMLFDNGREAEAFNLLNRREYPGWGYMIAQGSRTMWEGWEDIESHSHAWNGYPARLLQEYIVGIRSEAPGAAKVVIRPYMPDSLSYAEAAVWTAQGRLFVRWERTEEGDIRLQTSIPSGVEARLEAGNIKENIIHTEQAGMER